MFAQLFVALFDIPSPLVDIDYCFIADLKICRGDRNQLLFGFDEEHPDDSGIFMLDLHGGVGGLYFFTVSCG